MGEALWLRRFSGTVKQEVEKGGRNLRGKIPESWRLIVKCLEIPWGSQAEGRGKEKVKMESHHPSRQVLPATWSLWLDSASTGLFQSHPESVTLPRSRA